MLSISRRNTSKNIHNKTITVKLDFKELLIKEQIDFKELFTDYQLFYRVCVKCIVGKVGTK